MTAEGDDFRVNGPGMAHALTALMSVHSFRDLVAWQRSMTLAVAIYRLTRSFPTTERFGLTFQLRKAAMSIPSNVAEGHVRPTPSYLYHLEVAIGSNAELQTQLELSFRAELADQSTVMPILRDAEEVGRLLRALYAAVKRRFESNASEG